MPPDMSVSMRHTKLKAEEAALLAGELTKPSWESRNEGIHERVSFEDAIWGFDLAGGAYYQTPLRVTAVKPNSRAEKAGIRPGDKLLRINDVDTSTLTIQEAHQMIIDSGIHLRLAVTAPEDEEDSYFCYEDPIENDYDSEEERRLEKEKAKKREIHAKVNSYWSLQWPWVSKRRIIYRESNCFMVPSKYEEKHRDKFSVQPRIRTQEDIVLYSAKNEKNKKSEQKRTETQNYPATNGYNDPDKNDVNKEHDEIQQNNKNILVNEPNGLDGNLDKIIEAEEESNAEEITPQTEDTIKETINSLNENAPYSKDDQIISEVLHGSGENVSVDEEENILNGILSDDETNNNDSILR